MTSIQNVGDMKARALLRGLIGAGLDSFQARATLNRLLSAVNSKDLIVVDELLRKSSLFKHLKIISEFPSVNPFQAGLGAVIRPSPNLTINYIRHRAYLNANLISKTLNKFHDLNSAMARDDDGLTSELILEIIALSGHSLTLARKMAFIIGYAPKESLSHRACLDLVATYGLNDRNYGIMATIDTIGREFNYLDLRYNFRDFTDVGENATLSQKLSYLAFFPVASSNKEVASLISASYEISLIDAVISFLVHRELEFIDYECLLPASVEDGWSLLCAEPTDMLGLFDKTDPYCDLHAFRAGPAFLEHDRVRRLRVSLQPVYEIPAFRQRHGKQRERAAAFFDAVDTLHDILPGASLEFDPLPSQFDHKTAGQLSRSSAVIWVCEKDPDFAGVTADSMAKLMGHTSEIDRLLSPDTLRNAAARATDPFVKLILHTLLRAHSTSTRDNYNFKEQFQRYVQRFHDGNILDFMKKVRCLNEDIVQYFMVLLDETLLSQMPLLMESSNQIYETRAEILEWFAEITGDTISSEKARQLRLDRKIAEVRGVINETRINIDAIRFRQWIEQNKITEFSDFVRQSALILPDISEVTDKSKQQSMFLAAHREPTTRALLAIVECYAEFCKNPDYGIASFLGRRIRHGTLRGTLLDGVESPEEVPASVATQYFTWTKEFSDSIDAFATRLHFRDKSSHKNGLISPEIDMTQKWQACLVCLKSIYEQAQKDLGILNVPLLIEQYCWFIFEIELSILQEHVAEGRAKWGMIRLRHSHYDLEASAFESKMNIILNDRFNTVGSWFRKPPNISPVAELGHVIEVVLKEARGEYGNFNPAIGFKGDKELKLVGLVYYIVYDALTIAIRNAAKHGPHPGRLCIDASVLSVGSANVLQICVSSDLKSGDCPDAILKRMQGALDRGADGADVVEGLSGMRKLKKMHAERSVLEFSTEGAKGEPGRITVRMLFPHRGLVE